MEKRRVGTQELRMPALCLAPSVRQRVFILQLIPVQGQLAFYALEQLRCV